MFVNIIKSYRDVVAICDKEILGKTFEEEVDGITRQLDIKESFYKGQSGKIVSEAELIELIKSFSAEDATFNIVGKKAVSCAIKAGIITEDVVNNVKGVPFALVLL